MNLENQVYRQRHLLQILAKKKAAYWRNHDTALRKNREYAARNREHRRQVFKRYRETHQPHIAAYQHEYYLTKTKPKRQQGQKKTILLPKNEIHANPIRAYRKSAGLTQQELGRALGCSRTRIADLERSLAMLTASTTQKLAHALSLPHEQLRQAYLAYRERLLHLQKE